jgi:hypothetical protein
MILRITVGDNDFTEELEQFARDIEGSAYILKACKLENTALTQDEKFALFKRADRFRELFYNTDKYTPELAAELCELVRQNWENFVNYIMCDHDWWDEAEAKRIKGYLIRDFKVKFQKSLTPKWENGEVVYICCGYHRRYWTF